MTFWISFSNPLRLRNIKSLTHFFPLQVGVTRCNVDDSIDSTHSGSTCNSPMIQQRDVQQPLLQGKCAISVFLTSQRDHFRKRNIIYV